MADFNFIDTMKLKDDAAAFLGDPPMLLHAIKNMNFNWSVSAYQVDSQLAPLINVFREKSKISRTPSDSSMSNVLAC